MRWPRLSSRPSGPEAAIVVGSALATLAAWAPYPAADGDGIDFGAIVVGLVVGLWLSLRFHFGGNSRTI